MTDDVSTITMFLVSLLSPPTLRSVIVPPYDLLRAQVRTYTLHRAASYQPLPTLVEGYPNTNMTYQNQRH